MSAMNSESAVANQHTGRSVAPSPGVPVDILGPNLGRMRGGQVLDVVCMGSTCRHRILLTQQRR